MLPISLLLEEAIVARAPQFQDVLRTISSAFERLGKWLQKRLPPLEALDTRTRSIPIIAWRGDSLSFFLDRSQHGTLTRRGDEELSWSSVGLDLPGRMVKQERLIPELLSQTGRALEAIASSLERNAKPRVSMFNWDGVSAGDLFGQIGLLFRATRSGLPALRRVVSEYQQARHRSSVAFWPQLHQAPQRSLLHTSESLGEYTRYIVAGLIVLPRLTQFLDNLLGAGGARVQLSLLDVFSGIEKVVLSLRQSLLQDLRRALVQVIAGGMSYLLTIKEVIISNFRFYASFGIEYGSQFVEALREFLQLLKSWIAEVLTIPEWLKTLEKVLSFDLMPVLMIALGLPQGIPFWELAKQFGVESFTLLDLLTDQSLRVAMQSFLLGIEAAGLALSLGEDITVHAPAAVLSETVGRLRPRLHLAPRQNFMRMLVRRLNGAREALWFAQRPAPTIRKEGRAAPFSIPSFPDIFATFFGRRGQAALGMGRILSTAGDNLRSGVNDIFVAGQGFFASLQEGFLNAGDASTRVGADVPAAAFVRQARELASTALGPQQAELQRYTPDQLGTMFEDWLVDRGTLGAFQILEAAIPLYVEKMQSYFAEKRARGEEAPLPLHPTSPHILAERALITRVQQAKLVITAHAPELNKDLAKKVAERFRAEVSGAYHQGVQRRLEYARQAPAASPGSRP